MGNYAKNRILESASTSVLVPAGNTATRPTAPIFGAIRYNTDLGFCEFYNGSIWQVFGTGGQVNYEVDSFTGNGTQTVFTMSIMADSPDQIIVFVGSIYQDPTTAYTVGGPMTFDITFTSPPPNGIPISVIHTVN